MNWTEMLLGVVVTMPQFAARALHGLAFWGLWACPGPVSFWLADGKAQGQAAQGPRERTHGHTAHSVNGSSSTGYVGKIFQHWACVRASEERAVTQKRGYGGRTGGAGVMSEVSGQVEW